LARLMREIALDKSFALQLVVTGAHLAPRFGETWREIEADGFSIDAKVDIGLGDDTPIATARAMGRAVAGLADAFDRLRPGVVVLLGDRYEILAAAQTSLLLGLPVAHIHGGELTEGAFDDSFRHAITKLAHLHFVACEDYARRVAQLGEDPARVHVVGALGIDALNDIPRLDRAALASELGLPLRDPILVVTYHPETLGKQSPGKSSDTLCAALDRFPTATIVITGANADPGGATIDRRLQAYAARHPDRVRWFASLGQRRYFSILALAAAVVGNSSSALIEAPALKIATVNLGNRERGRPRAASVIDCEETEAAIAAAIAKALSPEFRAGLSATRSPYGEGGAAKRIAAVLRSIDPTTLGSKRFRDLSAVA
jgi:UDP-hydrolysing UDP-N-acetyl-D-glucosamine 2-epimerase